MQAGGDDDEGELAGVHHPRVEADDSTLGAAGGGGAARRGALHKCTIRFTSLLTLGYQLVCFTDKKLLGIGAPPPPPPPGGCTPC